jgi:multicomponent Na+:H+ antiporter subunit G
VSPAGIAEIALLALGVAASSLAAFGLLRLPGALARVHCVSLASAAGSFCFTAAVLIDRGGSPLGFKSLATVVLLLLTGAVSARASGRALRLRQRAPGEER